MLPAETSFAPLTLARDDDEDEDVESGYDEFEEDEEFDEDEDLDEDEDDDEYEEYEEEFEDADEARPVRRHGDWE